MPGRRRRRQGGRLHRGGWFLEPALLLLLHHSPAHGYALIEQLSRFGLEGLQPSVTYRALRDMDEKGWVTSSWDVDGTQGPPRRVYHLAAPGDEVLGSYMRDLRQTRKRIGDLMDAYDRHMMKEGDDEHH
jgi:DNA-binding PadR family transcriptional regulator